MMMVMVMAVVVVVCTTFSTNIGGVATLTGTPPNVIFKGLADQLVDDGGGGGSSGGGREEETDRQTDGLTC